MSNKYYDGDYFIKTSIGMDTLALEGSDKLNDAISLKKIHNSLGISISGVLINIINNNSRLSKGVIMSIEKIADILSRPDEQSTYVGFVIGSCMELLEKEGSWNMYPVGSINNNTEMVYHELKNNKNIYLMDVNSEIDSLLVRNSLVTYKEVLRLLRLVLIHIKHDNSY